MTIDRQAPLPLYYQLKRLLSERIESGDWKPGDLLPTELNLQETHGLSRTTVRQAIRELEIEGLVTRYRGRGTFVAEEKITHSPEPHKSLSDFVRDQGRRPGWSVISANWIEPNKRVFKQLKLDPKEKVFCLKRLRLADDQTIGFHSSFVAPKYSEAIDENKFEKGGSLFYLMGKNHLQDSSAFRVLEAVPATEEEAAFLGVDIGFPLLLVKRLVVNKSGVPIEYFHGVYRGDRFQYQVNNLPPEVRQ